MQTSFETISKSVSRYTAVALACILKDIPLTSIKSESPGNSISYGRSVRGGGRFSQPAPVSVASDVTNADATDSQQSKEELITRLLSHVRVDIVDPGMRLTLQHVTEEEVDTLRQAFAALQLSYIEEMSPSSNPTNYFTIPHNQVFRLLFSLGFDARDVFDAYEAARGREDIHLLNAEVSVTYKQYAAVAKLTKDLQEMRAKIAFRCSQFRDEKLVAIQARMTELWKLITGDLSDFATISIARGALYNQLQNLALAFNEILQDETYKAASNRSLKNLIFTECDAMAALCLFYSDRIWSQFLIEEKESVAVASLEAVSTGRPVSELATVARAGHAKSVAQDPMVPASISFATQAAMINPNPITGNIQIGARITATGEQVPSVMPRHLIFIVDVSGSMGHHAETDSGIFKAAHFIGEAINQLNETDGFDIITFDTTADYRTGGFGSAEEKAAALTQRGTNFLLNPVHIPEGGITNLDLVAQLISMSDSASLRGRPVDAHQSVVILLSDGATSSTYANERHYIGNPGASSIVRDALLNTWHLNPASTRFVAMGLGSNFNSKVLVAFADDGDFVLLNDSFGSDGYTQIKEEFLAKCRPFTRVEMTGSLATQDGLFGCMETTRGRSQHVAYIELITNMLSQRLPFLVISSAIMPFLQPERWLCLSQGETVSRTLKFVIPSRTLVSPLSFWVQVRLSDEGLRAAKKSNDIEIDAAQDNDLNTMVTAYESDIATTQDESSHGVANAQAYQRAGGRHHR
ncbi:MAG: hypothetical protein KBB94_08850 [Legionellaceae bacterium]|nr:hypothetical protein [Legionellaceae bacterium]MBP9776151.1 hypothetical protein [Legionellaceae bacterium]